MSVDVTTDLQHAVEDAAAYLYVWALKDIPQDLRDALAAARLRETSVPGKRVLETIHRNINVADSEKNLVCQDTGIAVYHVRVGEHFPLHPARIYEGLRDGDVLQDRLQNALSGDGRLAPCGICKRVTQVLWDVLQRPDVEVRRGIFDCGFEIGDGDRAHALAFSAAALPARRPKTQHSSRLFPIMRLRPCVPPAISPHA